MAVDEVLNCVTVEPLQILPQQPIITKELLPKSYNIWKDPYAVSEQLDIANTK
jgi:hypothetical protein